MRGQKWGVGCLWNFAKRLKNGEFMSFLAKDDALEVWRLQRFKFSENAPKLAKV